MAGQAVVERGLGGHDAATPTHRFTVTVGIEAEHPNRSPIGVDRARDHPGGGGLARTVRTQQHGDAASRHDQVQVVKGIDGAEPSSDPTENDRGFG